MSILCSYCSIFLSKVDVYKWYQMRKPKMKASEQLIIPRALQLSPQSLFLLIVRPTVYQAEVSPPGIPSPPMLPLLHSHFCRDREASIHSRQAWFPMLVLPLSSCGLSLCTSVSSVIK